MFYWVLVILLALAVPFGIVAAVGRDGPSALVSLLSSRRLLFFVSLLATGVISGLFVGTELGQLRVQEGLSSHEFAFFKQRFELAVGGIMPPLMILTTLSPLPLLLAVRRGPRTTLVLVGVAFALWIAATIVTIVFNVPVNSAARTWDPSQPPTNWEELRANWHLGQTLRTGLTLPAFAALLCAALVDERRPPGQ